MNATDYIISTNYFHTFRRVDITLNDALRPAIWMVYPINICLN